MKEKTTSSLSTPIRQESVVMFVIERIKEAIINGEIKPGDYLPTEAELTRNLEVSKTSLREAVKMLQALGVMEVKRGQGTRVRERIRGNIIDPLIFQLILQNGPIEDIVEFRMMFEPAYSLLAMQNATEEDLQAIGETVKNLERKIETGTPVTEEDDTAFHRAILHSTHNPFVIMVGDTVQDLFRASLRHTARHRPENVLCNHQAIFDAFCEKDPEKLREAIVNSFEGWRWGLDQEQKRGR